MENNNYSQGEKLIRQSDYTAKGVKTFKGMEGIGVNANIYLGKKKIAEVIDSGDGGCLNIDYVDRWLSSDGKGGFDKPKGFGLSSKEVEKFLKTLPTFTNRERGYDFSQDEVCSWDEEDFMNQLINNALSKKDFDKAIKKVLALTDDGFRSWNQSPSKLDSKFTFKGSLTPLRDIISKEFPNALILNDMDYSEAFDVWLVSTK
jgi:hypothetical protein